MLSLFLGRVSIDGTIATGSHNLSSPGQHFTSADIGRAIDVIGGDDDGLGGFPTLVTTITGVSGDVATLALVSRVSYPITADNYPAIGDRLNGTYATSTVW